jgi:hypothetical protein
MNIKKKAIGLLAASGIMLTASVSDVYAGNEDRAGSAGATELLINPWARGLSWAGAGTSSVTGIEATYLNVAGLAYGDKTELMFSRTNWLTGSDISINAIGLGQRVGESSVLGLSVVSMSFGDIPITTTALPEGGIGTFSPQYTNIGLAYARKFSDAISGGINIKVISEAIANVNAQGIAFDAGIRYVTGETDNMKFAISLKNVGPPMVFDGDGLAVSTINAVTGETSTTNQRSAKFELPSLVNIGASYDFNVAEMHKITLAGTFTSNSFTKDQFRFGLRYGGDFGKAQFILRGGLVYESGVFNVDEQATALTGPTAGVTVDVPMGKGGTKLGIDYAFRASSPFGLINTIGIRINVGGNAKEEEEEK